jgi:hypothetical protein
MSKALILLIIMMIPMAALAWEQARPDPLSPIRTYTMDVGGQKVVFQVDDSAATFSLSVPEDVKFEDYGDSAATVKEEEILYPSYVAASKAPKLQGTVLPSIELCGQRGKFFDDGMYGAMELTLEAGGSFMETGKRLFCQRLAEKALAKLAAAPPGQKGIWTKVASYAVAAWILSQPGNTRVATPNVPDDVMQAADKRIADFQKDLLHSKPLGFYALNPDLSLIFTRDRFLQQKLGSSDLSDEADTGLGLALLITENPELQQADTFFNNFYGRLTNPQSCLTVDSLAALGIDPARALADPAELGRVKVMLEKNNGIAIIPPSRSAEVDLINQAGGLDAVSGDTMQLLIDAVKSGKLSLAPKPNSGWYSYQQYALEILLKMDGAEAPKLDMNAGYRKRLEEAFRSMLTQARETHIKQLDMARATGMAPGPSVPKLYIMPDWRLEPIPTYYQRVADGYQFLGNFLSSVLGNELAKIALLDPDIKPDGNLWENLGAMERLYTGFNIVASRGIGIKPVSTTMAGGQPLPPNFYQNAAKEAEQWLADWRNDPLMARDIRVIVPMGVNSKGQLTCWTVMGIRPITINAGYKAYPTVKQVAGPATDVDVDYEGMTYTVLVPVFSEVVIDSAVPLTRDEFRAICDAGKTKAGILAAIGDIHHPKGEGGAGEAGSGAAAGATAGFLGMSTVGLAIVLGLLAGLVVAILVFVIVKRGK